MVSNSMFLYLTLWSWLPRTWFSYVQPEQFFLLTMTPSVNRLDKFPEFGLCIHKFPLYFELNWDSCDPVEIFHCSLFFFVLLWCKTFCFSVSDVVKGPDSLELWQFFMNLFTHADTLNALCNSYFSNSLSNALAISIVFATICFSSLASF